MKMNSAQIDRTMLQLDAKAIPLEHPSMQQLEKMFGEHTYFLDGNGLNIVEPIEAGQGETRQGVVVNLASWAEGREQTLETHEPEATGRVIDLGDGRH